MRKVIGLVGFAVLSGWILGFAPPAVAADYSVRFGELQGADHKTLAPTSNIKLCEQSTGYRFGYEIVPSSGNAYEYYTIFYLPAPAARVGFTNPVITEGGKEIKTQALSASSPTVESFHFDNGDPAGAWKLDVVVQNAVVATIKFDVVPAVSCP